MLLSAALAGLMLVSAPPAAAQIYYLHDVRTADGRLVSGHFTLNSSGFASDHDLVTRNGALTGYHYINDINVSYNPGDTEIIFYHNDPSYDGFLKLTALNPINAVTVDPLVFGGASLECSSYTCPGGVSRNIVSGFLSTTSPAPELSSWLMMVIGFGAIGSALRTRREKTALAPI